MEFKTIISRSVSALNYEYTDWFEGSDFVFFSSPELSENEGIEIAAAFNIKLLEEREGVPTIDHGEKEVPIENNQIQNTQQILPVPREVADTNLPCRIIFYPAAGFTLVGHAVSLSKSNKEVISGIGELQDNNAIESERIDSLYNTVLDLVRLSGGDITTVPSIFSNLVSTVEGLPSSGEQPEVPNEIGSSSQLLAIFG